MGDVVQIERVGGMAGFGLPGGHLRSTGQVDLSTLSAQDQASVDALFAHPPGRQPVPDAFRYRLTRSTLDGKQTVEVPESDVPASIAGAVKDELL